MLPLKRRVKKASFEKIMKEGVFVHGTNFYLKLLDRKDNSPSLFSFVVPNKVKRTSVGRHLIKRKITAVVENLLTTLKSGYSVIFFTKKDVSALPYSDIEREMVELLKKARIIS
jgi:ribonuclease P protein component